MGRLTLPKPQSIEAESRSLIPRPFIESNLPVPLSSLADDAFGRLVRRVLQSHDPIKDFLTSPVGIAFSVIFPPFALATWGTYAAFRGVTAVFNMLTAKLPSTQTGNNEDSPTYSFSLLKNTHGWGTVIPVVYGSHKVGGHVLSESVSPFVVSNSFVWNRLVSCTSQGQVVGGDGITRWVVRMDQATTSVDAAFTALFQLSGSVAYVCGKWKFWYKRTVDSSWTLAGFGEVINALKTTFFKSDLAETTYDVGVSLHYHCHYTTLPTVTFTWNRIAGDTRGNFSLPLTTQIHVTGSDIDFNLPITVTQQHSVIYVPNPDLPEQYDLEDASGSRYVATLGMWFPAFIAQDVYTPLSSITVTTNVPNVPERYMVLIAVSEGEIHSISNIEINGQALSDFRGSRPFFRAGSDQQPVISDFRRVSVTTPVGALLSYNAAVVRTTDATNAIEVVIQFPQGLFSVDGNNNMVAETVTIRVEYKRTTDMSYTQFFDSVITAAVRSPFKRRITLGLAPVDATPVAYDIRVTRLSANTTELTRVTTSVWLEYSELLYHEFSYPNIALVGVDVLASDQLSGQPPTVTCVVFGKLCLVPRLMIGGVDIEYSDCYWDAVDNSWKRFGDNAVATDTGLYIRQWTNNPVWHIYDMFVNARYGAGAYINPSTDILLSQLKTEAQVCDTLVNVVADGSIKERRYEHDRVCDSYKPFWDLILEMANSCQAVPSNQGSVYTLSVQRSKSRSQVLNSSNTKVGSVAGTFMNSSDKFNSVLVQFNDKREEWALVDEQFENQQLSPTSPLVTKSVSLLGVSKVTQVERRARFELAFANSSGLTLRATTGNNFLRATVMDRVGVQCFMLKFDSDVQPQAARVVAYTAPRTLVLDSVIQYNDLYTYGVVIQHLATGTIESFTVDLLGSGIFEHDTVKIIDTQSFAEAPAVDDVVTIGLLNEELHDFLIVKISKVNNVECVVNLIEYVPGIYIDPVPEDVNVDRPNKVITAPSQVTDLRASIVFGAALHVKLEWVVESFIASKFVYANVYRSYDMGVSWSFIGTGKSDFSDPIATPGITVLYRVRSVNSFGRESDEMTAPVVVVRIENPAMPPNVVGLHLFRYSTDRTMALQPNNRVFIGRDAKFAWLAVSGVVGAGLSGDGADTGVETGASSVGDIYQYDYVVTIRDSIGRERRTETVKIPEYIYTYEKNEEDGRGRGAVRTFDIEVRARNVFGNVSHAAARFACGGVTNEQEPAPLVSLVPYDIGVRVELTPTGAVDHAGYRIHKSSTPGFVPSLTNLVYDGPDPVRFVAAGSGTPVYIRAASYDIFDKDNLVYSEEVSSQALGANYASVQFADVTIPDGTPGNPIVAAYAMTVRGGAVNIRWTFHVKITNMITHAVAVDIIDWWIIRDVGQPTQAIIADTGGGFTFSRVSSPSPDEFDVIVEGIDDAVEQGDRTYSLRMIPFGSGVPHGDVVHTNIHVFALESTLAGVVT